MKLSDYVAHFIASLGVKHVFAISGGASVHLIDSIAKHPEIDYICPNHEQAGAMAADAYSRATENIGVAISTSGPGVTNMITGICCSYYDSVPALYITGQVSTFRLKKDLPVRQIGFQETDTLEMLKPVTKYCAMITEPQSIRYELEKAIHIAKSGRPGPVVIDIPDNISRCEVDVDKLLPFEKQQEKYPPLQDDVSKVISLLMEKERPVMVIGFGVRLGKAEESIRKVIRKLQIPVLISWAMKGFLDENDPLYAGTFGTHGSRHGNLTVQNADLVLSIGCRLDTHEVGSPLSSFAREAVKVVVDIDRGELLKFAEFGGDFEMLIQGDSLAFSETLNQQLEKSSIESQALLPWKSTVLGWKQKYPVCQQKYFEEKTVNPYVLVNKLSNYCPDDAYIICDTGCSLAWMMQGFPANRNQRIVHAFNNTPMGYALPAAIGSCFARDGQQVTCISGDGGLQMNIQELINIIYHKQNIKILLFNNDGYSMICQTQDQWLGSNYEAADKTHGLALPNFLALAKAYGFPTFNIELNSDIDSVLQDVYSFDGPAFCNIQVSPEHRVTPQVKFGRPIEDPEPLLPRKDFLEDMIVKPLDVSSAELNETNNTKA
jgi:acetolactate synthase I/II/III large subunit